MQKSTGPDPPGGDEGQHTQYSCPTRRLVVVVLKNGRAKAVRFSTLEAKRRVLDCQPGDLLEWVDE